MDIIKITDWFGLTKSKGVLRTLSAILVVISYLPIDAIAPYAELMRQLGAVLGGTGVARAYAAKILGEK